MNADDIQRRFRVIRVICGMGATAPGCRCHTHSTRAPNTDFPLQTNAARRIYTLDHNSADAAEIVDNANSKGIEMNTQVYRMRPKPLAAGDGLAWGWAAWPRSRRARLERIRRPSLKLADAERRSQPHRFRSGGEEGAAGGGQYLVHQSGQDAHRIRGPDARRRLFRQFFGERDMRRHAGKCPASSASRASARA